MQLYRHQLEASTFLANRVYALLWGDPGVGKTAAILRALTMIEAATVLVLAPLSAVLHWTREPGKFGFQGVFPIRDASDIKVGRWLVMNPDKLYNLAIVKRLRELRYDVIVLDESQQFKSRTAKRTRIILGKTGLARQARRVWLSSGTPFPNGPIDAYVQCRVLFPEVTAGHTFDSFVEAYHVLTPDKLKILGSRNLHILREKLSPHMLRQSIDDCLDLPPLTFSHEPLPASELIFDYDAYQQALRAAQSVGFEPDLSDDLLGLVRDNYLHLSTLRSLLATAKTRAVQARLTEELSDDKNRKIVVFSWHLGPLRRLYASLDHFGPVILTGDVPPVARQRAIDAFQTDPRCRLFLAQGAAGGLGITLHAARETWFIDTSWTPGPVVQAAKRLHRIGQRWPVTARLFSVAGTIDDAVTNTLIRKAVMIAGLADNVAEAALI
jgi:SNF2 family DNA or RNA helicase